MTDITTFTLLAFTSFFTLINPLGVMPIFITLTKELSAEERARTASKAIVVAFTIGLWTDF